MPRRLVNQHFIGDLVPCCCHCLEILDPTYAPPSASALANLRSPRLIAADCDAAGTFDAVELYQSTGSNAMAGPAEAGRHVRTPANAGRHVRTPANAGRHVRTPANAGRHVRTPANAGRHVFERADDPSHRGAVASPPF